MSALLVTAARSTAMTRTTLAQHVFPACRGALRDAGRLAVVCALLLGLYVADRGDHLAALLGASAAHRELLLARTVVADGDVRDSSLFFRKCMRVVSVLRCASFA
jgi:hypothetical protein